MSPLYLPHHTHGVGHVPGTASHLDHQQITGTTLGRGRCLLLGGGSDLGLLGAAHLLHPVLALLALLPRRPLLLVQAVSLQPVLGLELLGVVQGVVDERESGGAAASEVGAEAEHEHDVGRDLVHGGQLVADLLLGHGGHVRVDHVAHHLFAVQQTVRLELAGAHSSRTSSHDCVV